MPATYDALITDMQTWLGDTRYDLARALPTFVSIAEDYLDQKVVHWRRHGENITLKDPSEIYDLPADFNGMVSVQKDASNVIQTYSKKLERLSTGTQTNWLLDEAGGLYLFTSLIQAEGWLKNDPRVDLWKAQAAELLAMLNEQGKAQPVGEEPPEDRVFRKIPLASTAQWIEHVPVSEAQDILRSGITLADNNGRQVYSIWNQKLHLVPVS